jgi:hypothetical protein
VTIYDKLKTYTPRELVDAAEAAREFIADPAATPTDRITFRQLLKVIEDEMRERLK